MNEDRYDLPEGWEWATLGKVAEITTGNTPSKSDPSNYGNFLPWVKPPQLDSDKPIIDTPEKLSKEGTKLARVLPKDSVLVSCIGLLGKVGIAGCDLATNQQINSLTFHDIVLPKYGYFYCKSKYFKDWLQSAASATTLPILNKGRFSEGLIPIAPPSKQRLIVKKIESLFEQLTKTKQNLTKIPTLLKKLRQSVLVKAFSGELTEEWRAKQKDLEPASKLLESIREERKELLGKKYKESESIDTSDLLELPEGWEWAYLGDIIINAQPGFASGKKDVKDGLPHLRMNNISSECNLSLELLRTVPRKLGEEKYLLKKGDVIICHTNSQKLIGKTAVFNLEGKYAFSNHLTRIRFFENTIISEWIWYYISTLWHQGYFETKCKQWVNQATIERDTLLEIPVPVPSYAEQNYAVKKIKEFFAQADTIEKSVKIAQAHCGKLTPSILAKAFRGELVS